MACGSSQALDPRFAGTREIANLVFPGRHHQPLHSIEEKTRVSRKQVVRLMQAVAGNLLDRQFEAEAPNQRWVGDTTEFVIGSSGKLYLAAILHLFSRFVVGWAVSVVNDRHLAIRALEIALKRRRPAGGLLHHSDQGSLYASEDYQTILEAQGVTCSMSRRGNCYDNAVAKSFFSTVKSELSDRIGRFSEAKNQRRRHSTLGQVIPAAFEKAQATQAA